MTAKISYQSFDYAPVTVVPVIASFDTNGHIAPLYVRLDGESLRISSYWIRSRFANIIEFNCKVRKHNLEKPLCLTYYKTEDMWTIPKS